MAQTQIGRGADPVWLGSLFDFTPAEVRLATALMRGADLAYIASAHHVSLGTVRVQLKSICRKTQTHRQAELVALLHRVTAL